jgi:hypothetical protein
MSLRFGKQALVSGLLFAAQVAFVGLSGTGECSAQITASQSGSGSVEQPVQEVTGTGSFAATIDVSQEGQGNTGLRGLRFGKQSDIGLIFAAQGAFLVGGPHGSGEFAVTLDLVASQTGQGAITDPQRAWNLGSTITWEGPRLTVSQTGIGVSQPPQAVSGSGSIGVEIEVSQSGTGEVEQPVHVDGSGDFSVSLTAAQTGSGESHVPEQSATGTGSFAVEFTVAQDGTGTVEVPAQEVSGTGSFSASLSASQSGNGVSVPLQEASGTGSMLVALAVSSEGVGSLFYRQRVSGIGEFLVEIEAAITDSDGRLVPIEPPAARTAFIGSNSTQRTIRVRRA